jgi:hypothetical protein
LAIDSNVAFDPNEHSIPARPATGEVKEFVPSDIKMTVLPNSTTGAVFTENCAKITVMVVLVIVTLFVEELPVITSFDVEDPWYVPLQFRDSSTINTGPSMILQTSIHKNYYFQSHVDPQLEQFPMPHLTGRCRSPSKS